MYRISTTLLLLASVSVNSWAQQLFTNGTIGTGTISNSGIIAPAGMQWSELQNDTSNPLVSNITAGFGTNGLVTSETAEDFEVPAGQTWTVSSFRFMGYQPGAPASASPFSKLTIRVWSRPPGTSKARVIFGDSTTDRLGRSTDALTYRIFNSRYPAGSASPTNLVRKVWEVEAVVSPELVLPAGTYWLAWSAAAVGTHAYFFVPVTTAGARTQGGANAQLHSTGLLGTFSWSPITDLGIGTTPAAVNVEMAFKIFGTRALLATHVNQPGPNALSMEASPVPAAEAVQIAFHQLKGSAELLLTDLNGRLAWTGQVQPGSTTATVPLTGLATGIYLLEARTREGSVRTRLVKE